MVAVSQASVLSFRVLLGVLPVASMDALLDAHEVAVRAQVEALREQAARIAVELAQAEQAVQDVAVTRATLAAALDRGAKPADPGLVLAPCDESPAAGVGPRLVPQWRPGMSQADLPAAYRPLWQAIVEADGPLRAGQAARVLGLDPVPTKIETLRWKAKRLAQYGWITRLGSGAFAACPAPQDGGT